MKLAVFSKNIKNSFVDDILSFICYLLSNQVELYVYDELSSLIKDKITFNKKDKIIFFDFNHKNLPVDFFISIGGDGTFLDAVNFIIEKNIPIIGINTGRLGFLTTVKMDEAMSLITNIKNENYYIEKRSLLELKSPEVFDSKYALNEFTIHKTNSSSMIKINAYLNSKFLNTYWADGLIVATPTGSTAYSMSVGAPIVFPNSKNLIITPIAPHNLTQRPVVIPDDCEVKLICEARTNKFLISLDHQSKVMDENNEFKISIANKKINFFYLNNNNFIKTLRSKLMWGKDSRN